MTYDVIIIGAGPAGFSAAVYCSRYKLKTLVIGELPGGLAGEASEVWNFPSYEKISGFELVNKMFNQVKNLGVEIKMEIAEDIVKEKKNFKVVTNKGEYIGKKIIFATGSKRKKLGLAREEELTGKGVAYCATCDAGFYQDKIVGVIGGGNSALSAAVLLTKYAEKVYVFYRKGSFCKAEPSWIEDVKKNEKIEVIFSVNVVKLLGKENLEKVELDNGKKIKLDGLFIEVGSIPQTKLAEKIGVKLDCENIEVDKEMKTNVDGVFAAGDVTNNPLKQIITACGEGAVAAYSAYGEISKE